MYPSFVLALVLITLGVDARKCPVRTRTTTSAIVAPTTASGSPGGSSGGSFAANVDGTSTSGALSAVKYTNVGGSGSYQQVTGMPEGVFPTCSVNPSCIRTTKQVSGNLAPFNEDVTLVFRGPMDIYNLAVYQPSGSSWSKTSSWSAGQAPSNMVFLNNMGGSQSGTWSICQGASQSFASSDFTSAASGPQNPSGSIPAGHEMNIMTSQACSGSNCNGFYRGESYQGWSGAKMFVMEFDMGSDMSALPAIWALNAQVVRSAQYGCNCRGEGGDGGCGELDIIETIGSQDPSHGISEIYSFNGATGVGDGNYFARPTAGKVTYAVIFNVDDDAIAIQRWTGFDFSTASIAGSAVEGMMGATAMIVPFGKQSKRRDSRPTLHARRRH